MSTRLQDDWICLGLLVSLILLTTACGREVPAYCEDVDPVSEEASAPFLLPETEESMKSIEEIEGIWRSSPHAEMNVQAASNYVPTCNRCHDRLNWAPAKTSLGTQDLSNSDGKSARLIGNTTDGCRICHPEPGESSTLSASCLLDPEANIALISVNANSGGGISTPVELGGYYVDDVRLTAIKRPVLPVRFVK